MCTLNIINFSYHNEEVIANSDDIARSFDGDTISFMTWNFLHEHKRDCTKIKVSECSLILTITGHYQID